MPLKMGPKCFEFEHIHDQVNGLLAQRGIFQVENLGCLGRQWGPTGWGATYVARSVCL